MSTHTLLYQFKGALKQYKASASDPEKAQKVTKAVIAQYEHVCSLLRGQSVVLHELQESDYQFLEGLIDQKDLKLRFIG